MTVKITLACTCLLYTSYFLSLRPTARHRLHPGHKYYIISISMYIDKTSGCLPRAAVLKSGEIDYVIRF